MDTTQPRTRTHLTARRLVGALTSVATVAVIGTGALTPATAQAAGVATGHRVPVPTATLADPAAVTLTSAGTNVVAYRVRGTQLERL